MPFQIVQVGLLVPWICFLVVVVERRTLLKGFSLAYIAQNIFFSLKTLDWIMPKTLHTPLNWSTWREAERALQVRFNARHGLWTRIVADRNKMMLRIYNCKKRMDEELSTIIYRSTKSKYFFDLE